MRLLRYILILLMLSAWTAQEAKAQIDTVFWFAAPWSTPDHWWRDPIAFHVSTFNQPTTVRIQQPASAYDTTFIVPANTLFSKYVDFMIDSVESKPADQLLRTGFKITSDFPVTIVYDIITRSPSFYNPETFSLKGQNGMGTEFILPFQTRWNNRSQGGDLNGDGVTTQPYQQFSVVATEDNTILYITPRCAVVGHPAGVTYSVVLPFKGNVYTCQNVTQSTSVAGNNLSGTIVVATKAVSITVADDSVQPVDGCADILGDQMVPTDVIGNEYIVNKGFLSASSDESVFIVAVDNFTSVSVNNGLATTNTILNQGETYKYSITEALTYVKSDKPIYLLHMSGYGCELGSDILPPLNCAGSDQVSFSRANGQSFLLNILCKSGSENSFTLNGSTTLVTAANFTPVPGTGGLWLGAQISFNTTNVPVGSANLITNSTDLFSLGIINGGSSTGCLYHYVSSFLRRVYTAAGNDTTLCNGEPFVELQGKVSGGTTSGEWEVLNGSGTIANPTSLDTQYAPTASDYAQGTLTFVLSSTGNCAPVRDTMVVTFIQSPVVSITANNTYCKNNLDSLPIVGTLSFAAGASWSGGSGGAFGNAANLNTYYSPSPADIAADSVALYLTSAGSFFSCPNDQDTIVIHFTDAPVAMAGPDLVICSNADTVSLSGTINSMSGTGVWTTSGSGNFTPDANNLLVDYVISSSDTAVGVLTLTLTTTNNGNCLAQADSLQITILDKPVVEITSSDSICSNLSSIHLTGTISPGFSANWSTNGAGNVLAPGSLDTYYNISPLDTVNAYLQVYLTSTAGICAVEVDSMRIYFVSPPVAYAGIDQAFCNNEAIQLNGNVAGAAPYGSWSSTGTGVFSPGNNFLATAYIPSAADIAAGTINLILTSASDFGCQADKDTLRVTFKPAPVADFVFTAACQQDNTVFTDSSTTTDGTINSWFWDFGDTITSIANNPLHNYTSSGMFNVTLTVGSTNGCYDTHTATVTVNPLPIANFTNTISCQYMPVTFTDHSFISSGSIVGWQYNFGGGSVSQLQNPVFAFGAPNNYPVTLQVTSNFGCVGTFTDTVQVLSGPLAAMEINPNPALVLEDVNFTDISTGGPIVSWYWNFGDGEGDNSQNTYHNYGEDGDYQVILTVTDAYGCQDTVAVKLSLSLLPVLPTGFTPNGDGENDEFIIRGGPFATVDFKIYNSWGQLIFESNDVDKGWDGTYKGEMSPIGVYTWTFLVGIADGRVIKKSGDVTLIR